MGSQTDRLGHDPNPYLYEGTAFGDCVDLSLDYFVASNHWRNYCEVRHM